MTHTFYVEDHNGRGTAPADSIPAFGVYLHGEIEDDAGFDCVSSARPLEEMLGDAVSSVVPAAVFVRLHHGGPPVRRDVLAYLWRDRKVSMVTHIGEGGTVTRPERIIRGLICLPDDKLANAEAAEKMARRIDHL